MQKKLSERFSQTTHSKVINLNDKKENIYNEIK